MRGHIGSINLSNFQQDIKDLLTFTPYLAAKLGWKLISMENMWMLVVKRKYIDPIPMDEWLRKLDKGYPQAYVVWKETLDSIKIIEQGPSWHVGNIEKIRVGEDPWVDAMKDMPYVGRSLTI